LTAERLGTEEATSLEGKSLDFSQVVSSARKEHPGVLLNLVQAQVRNATGKLGALGKQIEIAGTIPETTLTETLNLEIYDDFPNLALLSVSVRNTGQSDVPLDWVTLQRHQFAAPLDSKSPSHPLWTFQGSSLMWGKDETFLMPAKFSQENPFGAPVPTKDDIGYVGGGIPVVAFWSRAVGEAIGHVETVPLTLSIPVHAAEAGKAQVERFQNRHPILREPVVIRQLFAVQRVDRRQVDAQQDNGLRSQPIRNVEIDHRNALRKHARLRPRIRSYQQSRCTLEVS
jgi:hypothetical protein